MKIKCNSTHGGSGYSPKSFAKIYRYKDNPTVNIQADVTCGQCREVIKNANPTSKRYHFWSFKENPFKWIKKEIKFMEPVWPDWMGIRYYYIDRPVSNK